MLGGGVSQFGAGFGRRGDRKAARNQRKADLRREACDACRTSALAYRKSLMQARASGSQADLVESRSQFSVDVSRIHDDKTATALVDWSNAAFEYAQGLIGSEQEDLKWTEAASKLGTLWQSLV